MSSHAVPARAPERRHDAASGKLPLPEAALALTSGTLLLSFMQDGENRRMHMLIMTAAGLILLGLSYFAPSHLFSTKAGAMTAFIWVWLAISIGNGLYGHFRAGVPVLN